MYHSEYFIASNLKLSSFKEGIDQRYFSNTYYVSKLVHDHDRKIFSDFHHETRCFPI